MVNYMWQMGTGNFGMHTVCGKFLFLLKDLAHSVIWASVPCHQNVEITVQNQVVWVSRLNLGNVINIVAWPIEILSQVCVNSYATL